jgi:hypothetical protein
MITIQGEAKVSKTIRINKNVEIRVTLENNTEFDLNLKFKTSLLSVKKLTFGKETLFPKLEETIEFENEEEWFVDIPKNSSKGASLLILTNKDIGGYDLSNRGEYICEIGENLMNEDGKHVKLEVNIVKFQIK